MARNVVFLAGKLPAFYREGRAPGSRVLPTKEGDHCPAVLNYNQFRKLSNTLLQI